MKKVLIVVLFLCVSILCAKDSILDVAQFKGNGLKSEDAFNFVIISDRTGSHVPGKWSQAVDEINLLNPDFVISVGDLIEGYTTDVNQIKIEWDEFDKLVGKFNIPFFYCPGNHDASNDIMLNLYQDRYGVDGKSYYSFDYKKCHFIILDSTSAIRSDAFAKEQVAWLKKDIEKAGSPERFFVFYHHPSFDKKDCWKEILKVFVPGKTTVFNGHWHNLNSFVENGFDFHVLAATGGGIATIDASTGHFFMFANVSVNKGKEKIAFIPTGQIQNVEDSFYYNKNYPLTKEMIAHKKGSDKFSIKLENPFDVPVDIKLKLDAEQNYRLNPLETKEVEFAIDAGRNSQLPCPQIEYGINLKRKRNVVSKLVPVNSISFPFSDKILVDGNPNEWENISGLETSSADKIIIGSQYWQDGNDLSFISKLASDGEYLYGLVEVRDDYVYNDYSVKSMKDAIEFYWDSRDDASRDGKHASGTGYVRNTVPAKNGSGYNFWFGKHKPKDFKFIFTLGSDGYICEFSIKLSQMGLNGDLSQIYFAIEVDDEDKADKNIARTCLATNGYSENANNTNAYFKAIFNK